MPFQINIQPSNHDFSTNEDETILEAALREGFVIAYGCRNGACGTCKGRVLSGKVDLALGQNHLALGQAAQFERPEAHPAQLTHGMADCLAHPPDLVLAALDDADFEPAIGSRPFQRDPGGQRSTTLERDSPA